VSLIIESSFDSSLEDFSFDELLELLSLLESSLLDLESSSLELVAVSNAFLICCIVSSSFFFDILLS
jgi:hypothetical protein